MTTRLDVINACLAVTGESPLNEEDERHPTVVTVIRTLDEMSASIQDNESRGYWFNRERVTLKQDTSGKVPVPVSIISANPVDISLPYELRGDEMYDPTEATYTIGRDVEVDVVRLLDFAQLPQVARQAIKTQVVLRFHNDFDADTAKVQTAMKFASDDMTKLRSAEIKNSRASTQNNPQIARIKQGYVAQRRGYR
jgi:hypothetical protein